MLSGSQKLVCPRRIQQSLRYEKRPGPAARSLTDRLLLRQRNGTWIDRIVLIVGIVVDHHISVSFQPDRIADDLTVQSVRPVVTIDRDRRGNRQDRAGHLTAGIAGDLDLLGIAGWHVEQETFIITTGGCVDPEVWISVPGYISGGEEKGHIIAIDMAAAAKVNSTATADMNHHMVTGQCTTVESKLSVGEQEFDIIRSDLWPQNTQTLFETMRAGVKDNFAETDKIDPAGMSASRDDLTSLRIN